MVCGTFVYCLRICLLLLVICVLGFGLAVLLFDDCLCSVCCWFVTLCWMVLRVICLYG